MGNMATEIVAFLLTISGWMLVSSIVPLDYWKVSSVDGTVITTATFWSNLWKTCVTDSTGVSNCKDFPSMLALDGEFETVKTMWTCSHYRLVLYMMLVNVTFHPEQEKVSLKKVQWVKPTSCLHDTMGDLHVILMFQTNSNLRTFENFSWNYRQSFLYIYLNVNI